MLESAIPLDTAYFNTISYNADKVPENSFSIKSDKPNRRVLMFWVPQNDVILCTQMQTHTKKWKWWRVSGPIAHHIDFQDHIGAPAAAATVVTVSHETNSPTPPFMSAEAMKITDHNETIPKAKRKGRPPKQAISPDPNTQN